MAKREKEYANKYWENEEGETIKFGNCFMRCFEEAGKLQFGKISIDAKTENKKYHVKFVLDREELLNSKEGLSYLQQTLDEWREGYED